ncbi:unnamed protein product [Caenorhabditis sp. 36 PRJEB53466]|nr:unnamed protein product [Caenorhabditis sp. 36 PRJEB53466]
MKTLSALFLLSLLGMTVAMSVDSDSQSSSEDDDQDHSHHHNHGSRPRPRPRPAVVPKKKCDAGWLTFDRPQGRWCVGLFYNTISQIAAQAECQKIGAVLTGVQNNDERIKIANAGRQILLKYNLGDAAIWLGARRRAACPRVGVCSPGNTFEWTDNFTTGLDGFFFSTCQPDGLINASGIQSCIHQFIFSNGDTHPTWPGIHHGDYDDQYCQDTSGPRRKLYACGKNPTV